MRAFSEGLHAALQRMGEPRFSALRAIATRESQAAIVLGPEAAPHPGSAPPPQPTPAPVGPTGSSRRMIAPTIPMRAVDSLPFAATAALPSGDISASLPAPSVRVSAPLPPAPLPPAPLPPVHTPSVAPPAAPPKPQSKGAVVAVLVVVVLFFAAGLVALRLFAGPF
jgi:hypothetical protein